MKDSLTTQVYINFILNDPNVSIIEAWDNKLFVWKYNGRPIFMSGLGLEFNVPIYFRLNDYKKVSKRYHPDLSKSKSSRVSSGEIQQLINDSRAILDVQSRGYNAEHYVQYYEEFSRVITSSNNDSRANTIRKLSARLYNHSRMVQDRFSSKAEGFETLIQEVVKTATRGQDIKDGLSDFFAESKESCRLREIEYWNKPSLFRKAKKNNYTVYGEASRGRRKNLRKQYGDVFRVHVGGPCDCSPL